VRSSIERQRNKMTIFLGYANAKIWKCPSPLHSPPSNYTTTSSDIDTFYCPEHDTMMDLVRHISFVDCPGHQKLMATMLNGTAIMDAAIMVVDASRPQIMEQTKEHFGAATISAIRHFLVAQNKIDLITQKEAMSHYFNLQMFLKGSIFEGSDILPISALSKLNLDYLAQWLANLPEPERDLISPPLLSIVRSFDVNKPGKLDISKLKGGVPGGALIRGKLKIGDEIEIRPGIISREQGKLIAHPVRSRVTALFSEKTPLKEAVPGGMIGVGTIIDPTLTRKDRMKGQIMGLVGKMPPVFITLEINYFSLGDIQKEWRGGSGRMKQNEIIKLHIGVMEVEGVVKKRMQDLLDVNLKLPVCCEIGQKMAICRKDNEESWRLFGFGFVLEGSSLLPNYPQ